MTIQSSDIYNYSTPLESPYSIIWGDDDPINPSEIYSTSTARIKPQRKVYEPIYIKFEELEAIRELGEFKKQRSDR